MKSDGIAYIIDLTSKIKCKPKGFKCITTEVADCVYFLNLKYAQGS